jgi:N-glycosylase/DNA lyase
MEGFNMSFAKIKTEYLTHFADDAEKMADFEVLTKEGFLSSYSYITEEEYDMTMEYCKNKYFTMIEKADVRKQLAKYENKVRARKKLVEDELDRMRNACATVEMLEIWNQSKEYAKLHERWATLNEVLMDIMDIRCDDILED